MRKFKFIYFALIVSAAALSVLFSCRNDSGSNASETEETMTAGTATFLVDNTIQPIVEDVIAVYQNMYDRATIKQVNRSEGEIIRALLADSARVAIFSRQLTPEEESYFKKKKISAKVNEFAFDAIALITNRQAKDTVVKLEEIIKVLKGETSAVIPKLVFDNPNSSTVKYLLNLAGVSKLPSQNVYALKNNEDVIKYVHDNNGAVGVIGLNWLMQPPPALTKTVENIRVLGVNNVKADKTGNNYYKPNQSNIGAGLYPLTRKLYVLNYQGKRGLGMGFANYITAPDGQRIILKSGLLPVNIPNRELEVRNEL
jgi:phosphate transport system substrate-binding protein